MAALWSLAPSLLVAGAAVGAGALGRVVDRAYVMGGGFVVAACGFLVITRVTPHSLVAVALVGATVLSVGLVTVMTLVTEIAMGAIDPARAGSASAVLETSSEFGGALGIAVLGSIGAAIYGSAMDSSMPAELPGDTAAVARETLAGATVVAAELPGVTGTEVLAAAREAFTFGMHGVGVVGAVLMIAAGAVCVLFLRRATVVDAAAVDEVVASTTG